MAVQAPLWEVNGREEITCICSTKVCSPRRGVTAGTYATLDRRRIASSTAFIWSTDGEDVSRPDSASFRLVATAAICVGHGPCRKGGSRAP